MFGSGIGSVCAVMMAFLVIAALSDFTTVVPFMGIAKIAFAFIILFHIFRLFNWISFRFYVIIESVSILAIIASGIGLNNIAVLGAGICFMVLFLVILLETFVMHKYRIRQNNGNFNDPI